MTASGLTPGMTYYFCAIASSAAGTGFGTVLNFTTHSAPTVVTSAALVTTTSAVLNGSATPDGDATTGWYRYGTFNPGTCDDVFGTRVPSSGGAALGTGSSGVAYTMTATGLTPGTTYYFCALASNSLGTSFGAVLSFTTSSSAPVVSTTSATSLTGTTATLNGSAVPGGSATTGWFRYASASPGSCNDSFGTRVPSSGGAALGAGLSSVPYALATAGLTPGTTYYFCALASNSVGNAVGAVLSFTTPVPPTVTTSAATSTATSGATLNGAANPNGAATAGYFRYATVDPGTCNDTFGTRAPTSGGTSLGAGTSSLAYSQAVTGLAPLTTYYVCAVATSSAGTSVGAVLSFTTPSAPLVGTLSASPVTASSEILAGYASPAGAEATGWFRYATVNPGTCDDSFGTRAPSSGGTALGAGLPSVPYTLAVTGLTPGTTYYFCAVASNAWGTGFGHPGLFRTLPTSPSVSTTSASSLTGNGAQLNGSANPQGDVSTGWFRYATASPGTCNDSFGTRVPSSGGAALGAGLSSVAFSQAATGLAPGTTYYFCAVASNPEGTSFGTVQSFTTLVPPAVTTSAATSITTSSATLNGAANSNSAATLGYFRYAAADPGTCNDTFGTRAPGIGGTALGAGSSNVAYSQAVVGLVPGTTYYFCAIGASSGGTSFGAVMSFTTHGAPVVGTSVATLLASSSATLNGSASPGGDATTGWFRYATGSPGTCNDSFGTRAPSSAGASLGAGTSTVAYAQAATGLAPATTYTFCAIASNSSGTTFGPLLSFTTLASAPMVSTGGVTSVTGTGAQLNGSSNPGGDATTGWFRVATVSPGSCNDSFGTRVPSSGGAALGAGVSSVAYAQTATGLAPGTTYYFCAVASNGEGTGFGTVQSFTTALPPTVTTSAATAVTSTSATLNGSASPNGELATGYFRVAATDPGSCDDSFGVRAPSSSGTALGSGDSPVVFETSLDSLAPGTTYSYCAIAENAEGRSFGELLTLTTAASPPEVTTAAPTGVTNDSAVLNGSAVANGDATTGWFRFDTVDPGACDDAFGARAPPTGGVALGAGTQAVSFSRALGQLTRGTTYYYCALAANSLGTAFGAIQVLKPGTTSPLVATEVALDVGGAGATLAGTANPNGAAATGWFRLGDVSPSACDDSFGTRVPTSGGVALGAGAGPVGFEEPLTGLLPNFTYSYCAAAANLGGATFGAIRSFTTAPVPPVVTTVSAVVVTGQVALNGLADPRGSETMTWFRTATADPVTCNDTFGTRWPAGDGKDVGAGRVAVQFGEVATGLPPGRYYACAIGSSAGGLGFGEVVTFEIPKPAPGGGGGGCESFAGSPLGGGAALLPWLATLVFLVRPRRRRN
jgi:YHS domain-containing protein